MGIIKGYSKIYEVYENGAYRNISNIRAIKRRYKATPLEIKNCIIKRNKLVVELEYIGLARDFIEYALYIGEEMKYIGNIDEIANYIGVKRETVEYYSSDGYKKKINSVDNCTVVTRIGFNYELFGEVDLDGEETC